jgi:hypothetical protein
VEPKLCFDFDAEIDFPTLPTPNPPTAKTSSPTSTNQSLKSSSSSITMSEINAVCSEMQAQFEADLKSFKDKMVAKLEHDIAETVKQSVATALEGINTQINFSAVVSPSGNHARGVDTDDPPLSSSSRSAMRHHSANPPSPS